MYRAPSIADGTAVSGTKIDILLMGCIPLFLKLKYSAYACRKQPVKLSQLHVQNSEYDIIFGIWLSGKTHKFVMNSSIKELAQELDMWNAYLEIFDENELRVQPNPENWSLGQLYMHLIMETDWYLQQVKICCSHTENRASQMSEKAHGIFQANHFPEARIKGHATVENVPQPANKEEVRSKMLELKGYLTKIEISKSSDLIGKTKHPGLGYFNGREWLGYATLHIRHHMSQRNRIENYVKNIEKPKKTKDIYKNGDL